MVKEQPDLSTVPHAVRRLLHACLEKEPKKRLHDIGDVRLLLEERPGCRAGIAVTRRHPGSVGGSPRL